VPRDPIPSPAGESLYPLYVKKAESKNRSKEEVDQVICWLTGYTQEGLRQQIGSDNDRETFFAQARERRLRRWRSPVSSTLFANFRLPLIARYTRLP